MASGRPDNQGGWITTSKFIDETKLDCTAAHTVHTLHGETKAFEVYNHGNNTVHMLPNGVADTDSRPMGPKTSRAMDVDADTSGFSCAAGETATVWVTELG